MIYTATSADEERLLALSYSTPCLGAGVEVRWRLLQQNHRLPYSFYMINEHAVLAVQNQHGTLFGTIADWDEFSSFVSFAGISRITLAGTPVPHWAAARLYGMELCSILAPPLLPFNIAQNVSPTAIVELLLQNGTLTTQSSDSFYASLCTRIVHNYASALGIYHQSKLVSTATAFDITSHETYIAAVETHPLYRKQGLASALIHKICLSYPTAPIRLLCHREVVPFYKHLGFTCLPLPYYSCDAPQDL